MTRYSPIIGYLLIWQLLMPLLCFFSVTWRIAAVTAIVFTILTITRNWEKNTYSKYSAIAVAVFSILLVAIDFVTAKGSLIRIVIGLWIYAQIAFTATSPYPLSIRMPLIIYTLAYIYMIPSESSLFIVVPVAFVFSSVICFLATRWRVRTKSLTTLCGPEEPPYSFSLATAIVAAVAINLGLTITDYYTTSIVPEIISLCLLSLICIWLLCATDWKKNVLAVTALVLMIILHIVSGIGHSINNHIIHVTAFVLSVSPVMFHTTAPVFRGMRIVITLYAVYSALNRHSLIISLSHTSMPLWEQHSLIIGIDVIMTLTLFLMAIHWKRNKLGSSGISSDIPI